jgi:hypothetical protein
MLDFSAYLAAQQLTQGAVTEALPDAPVYPDRVLAPHRTGFVAARRGTSLTWRRLAEIVHLLAGRALSAQPAAR